MSPECYNEVYEAEPLEEGEIDTKRDRKYRSCWDRRSKERQKLEKAGKSKGSSSGSSEKSNAALVTQDL